MNKIIKTTALSFIFLLVCNTTQAQFWKKLQKKAEKKIEREAERRAERRVDKKIDKIFDTAEDEIDGKRKKKKGKRNSNKNQNNNPQNNKESSEDSSEDTNNTVNYNTDFEPGKIVIYSDTFANDALNDFPVTWNTNSSGTIVTFNNDDKKWFRIGKGEFIPDGITDIPENATLEFDLILGKNYNWLRNGIAISFTNLNNRAQDFVNWKHTGRHQKANDSGVSLYFNPISGSTRGRTSYASYNNGKRTLTNNKQIDEFSGDSRNVHIAFWRQKTRLRVYIDGVKIWDLPRIFTEKNYNSLIFSVDGSNEEDVFYLTNLRLAKAGEDKRHALLETGAFTTNAILFESGSDNLKKSSYPTIQEIATVLQENPSINIQITGHTDADGDDTNNQLLSEKRALAVKNAMQYKYDIDASRIVTSGKGENQPVADNATLEGKSLNRRVEFIVIK